MEQKKLIILLMSCNNPLYEKEELACMNSFLRDAEGAGIPFYFYKAVSGEHPEPGFDEEAHTLYVDAPDTLEGTGKKTAAALKAILPLDFDYVIKTNVSTYLNINNILSGTRNWPGKDDTNIYGGRYIINKASLNVPFPRGCFMVLSKSMTEGMLETLDTLTKIGSMPKTDDTLICLATLYHITKTLKKNYMDKIKQVPSIASWTEDVIEDPQFSNAFAIRCKDENCPENTPNNLLLTYMLIKEGKAPEMNYIPATEYETGLGLMNYADYIKVSKMLDTFKLAMKLREKNNGTTE